MKCKACTDGIMHIEGWFVSRPVDMKCWECQGTSFKGMTAAQVKWYRAQYKALEKLHKAVCTGDAETTRLYAIINTACKRLGIESKPLVLVPHWAEPKEKIERKALYAEMKRRFELIPTTIAGKVAAC